MIADDVRSVRFEFRIQHSVIYCGVHSLPFGECRLKAKGGDGGQNGLKDIAKKLGTTRFARLRIGVGPEDGGAITNLTKHVLG